VGRRHGGKEGKKLPKLKRKCLKGDLETRGCGEIRVGRLIAEGEMQTRLDLLLHRTESNGNAGREVREGGIKREKGCRQGDQIGVLKMTLREKRLIWHGVRKDSFRKRGSVIV